MMCSIVTSLLNLVDNNIRQSFWSLAMFKKMNSLLFTKVISSCFGGQATREDIKMTGRRSQTSKSHHHHHDLSFA